MNENVLVLRTVLRMKGGAVRWKVQMCYLSSVFVNKEEGQKYGASGL